VNEKKGLPKPPLFTSDYIAIAEILEFAPDRFGQLILALMYYTADGTEPENLPDDLKMMFSIYRRKIDAAREKYENVCTVRAESGSKGGKAKAENGKERAAAKFNPPTKTQFQEAINHFIASGDLPEELDAYEVDSFFDKLNDDGWTINGAPIQTRADWESAILARFCEVESSLPTHVYYSAFSIIFPKSGKHAGDATSDFFDTFDESSKCWIVNGKSFPAVRWRDAFDQFMPSTANLATPSKCHTV